MGVSVLPSKDDGIVTIKVSGEFTFTMQREFRIAYENRLPNTKFKIDLSEVSHIDSAGLGILMAMRSKLGGDQAKIEICKCRQTVRDLMNIFHLGQYFRIS